MKEITMFTDCYCTQFRRAANGLTRIYDNALRPLGLRITQFSLLRGLSRLGKATVNELAAELALDRTTMSRNVKLLVEAGWIDSLPGEIDARERVLVLNDRGRATIQNAMPAWSKAQEQVERYMKRYLKGPTSTQLLEALEILQSASR